MFYVEAGAGDPLVLVMGFGGDHLAWGLQIPAFAAKNRVVAFDNRGVGQSDAPDAPYTTPMMADDTVGLMDALGIARAHVCGVSMGGMIAQEIALRHPGRVRTLQLHATLARPDAYMHALSASWGELRPKLERDEWLRMLALWLFAPVTYAEHPELIELLLQNALANPYPQSLAGFVHQGEAVRAHDTLERLRDIRCPTPGVPRDARLADPAWRVIDGAHLASLLAVRGAEPPTKEGPHAGTGSPDGAVSWGPHALDR